MPARSRPVWSAARLGLRVIAPQQSSKPHPLPAGRSAGFVRVSRMVQILDKYDEQNVLLGTTNVLNARLKAITKKRAINVLIVESGATNLRIATGVRPMGISSPQMEKWLLSSVQ